MRTEEENENLKRKAVFGIMLIALFFSTLMLAFQVQPVKAVGAIYIRADGSVDPSTAPIQRDGDLYTLTSNITTDTYNDGVVIERSNMTLDGAGYIIQGTPLTDSAQIGIVLTGRNNVTIKNLRIAGFGNGIMLSGSSNNTLSGNDILYNGIEYSEHGYGLTLSNSFYNTIFGNDISSNHNGVTLGSSSFNNISGNTISNNRGYWDSGGIGLALDYSSHNTISGNNISYNINCVTFGSSSLNLISGNILSGNYRGAISLDGSSNNNTVSDNEMHGSLGLSSNNTVFGNKIIYATLIGINVGGNNNIVGFNEIPVVSGYRGSPPDSGISISGSSNAIYGNIISASYCGVKVYGSNNAVYKNEITNERYGIWLISSFNNTIYKNNVRDNSWGVYLSSSSLNMFSENNIRSNSGFGVYLSYSSSNVFSENNITDNAFYESQSVDYRGIWLSTSSNNEFYRNNFIDNLKQIYADPGYANLWDDGYPSGGNFWSDYAGADSYSGPYQNETGNDGIGDWPYLIAPDNRDNYPYMKPVIPYYKFNVALTSLLPSRTVVPTGSSLLINATTESQGPYPRPSATFNLTLEATYNYEHTPQTRNIVLEANAVQGWNFSVPGPTITANISDNIAMTLKAADSVHHKFYVDYNGNGFPDVDEPQTAPFINTNVTLEFTLDRLGSFTYYCAYHQDTMVGSLAVNQLPSPPIMEIGSQTVTLEAFQKKNVTFSWNTAGFAKGNYTLSAYATPVQNETNTADNTYTYGSIIIAMMGDLTGTAGVPDGKVDIRDLAFMAVRYGTQRDYNPPDKQPYDPNADITGPIYGVADNKIDIRDLALAAKNYGKIDP